MSCLSEETIEALVAGLLDEADRCRALAHLRQCPACREAVGDTTLVWQALDPIFAAESRDRCPSAEQLDRYLQGTLSGAEARQVQEHLATCVRCAADLQALRAPAPGPAATRVIPLLHATAKGHPAVQRWTRESVDRVFRLPEPVRLTSLAPGADRQQRLAAATGQGFTEQRLTADASPYELEIVQFGEEIRLTVSLTDPNVPAAEGIVRVVLAEGDEVRLERLIAIQEGRGGCVLTPDEVRRCAPQQEPLTARVERLDAWRMLRDAGTAAVAPAVVELLAHADAAVRRAAIALLTEAGAVQVLGAIAACQEDADPSVRAAATRAVKDLEALTE